MDKAGFKARMPVCFHKRIGQNYCLCLKIGFGTSSGIVGLLDTRMDESPVDQNSLPLAPGPVWEVSHFTNFVEDSSCLLL